LIINLLAVRVGERPNIFAGMLPVIMDHVPDRAAALLIIDEHHLLPRSWSSVDGISHDR